MVHTSERDEEIITKFKAVCSSLNLDRQAANDALEAYENISLNYTLEGDSRHWLACSLYVACRLGTWPTVASASQQVQGNCVSLTSLLKTCDLSLLEFFRKMHKWSDMAHLDHNMRSRVERLENSFNVTTIVYTKFANIFLSVFADFRQDMPRAHRGKRYRGPTTPSDLLKFVWTLYVYMKGRNSNVSCELVNCYHLLLCCVDLAFTSCIAANQTQLLDQDFLRRHNNRINEMGGGFETSESSGILMELCQLHDGLYDDANVLRVHYFKKPVRDLIADNVIRGTDEPLKISIDFKDFDASIKALDKTYELRVLKAGDLDERVFLAEDACAQIGIQQTNDGAQETLRRSLQAYVSSPNRTIGQATPLTGRSHLSDREAINRSPVSTATAGVSKLQALLEGHNNSPSEGLAKVLREMSPESDPSLDNYIVSLVKQMNAKFCAAYADDSSNSLINKRLQLGETLFYKALEDMIALERKNKPLQDLASCIRKEVFVRSLFACCLEIVMVAYNSERNFPWILGVFELAPFSFYRVIEILIRAETRLWREIVKHLNRIEETILDSLAWEHSSPLWDAVASSGMTIPACEEVFPPQQIESGVMDDDIKPVIQRPSPAVSNILVGSPPPRGRPPLHHHSISPSSSLTDRYSAALSPSPRRKLFAAASSANDMQRPTDQLDAIVKRTVTGDSDMLEAPVAPAVEQPQQQLAVVPAAAPSLAATRPRRAGPLPLFFRKVYRLARVRLEDLCRKLSIPPSALSKIWTCLEHAIVNHIDLMRDRHLDQIIMCSLYVVCKVIKCEKNFADIISSYRNQPQSSSVVYRSVLLRSRHRRQSAGAASDRTSGSSSPAQGDEPEASGPMVRSSSTLPVQLFNSQPPTPTRCAGTASSFQFEDRGDIIKFYNVVFLDKVTPFALRFGNEDRDTVPLSPLPRVNSNVISPRRRVKSNLELYLSPYKANILPQSPCPQAHTYRFNESPAKELEKINAIVRRGQNRQISKRILLHDGTGEDEPPPKQIYQQLLQPIISDRQKAFASSQNSV